MLMSQAGQERKLSNVHFKTFLTLKVPTTHVLFNFVVRILFCLLVSDKRSNNKAWNNSCSETFSGIWKFQRLKRCLTFLGKAGSGGFGVSGPMPKLIFV